MFQFSEKNILASKYINVGKVFCLALVPTGSLPIVLPPEQNTELMSNFSVTKSTPSRYVSITGRAFKSVTEIENIF